MAAGPQASLLHALGLDRLSSCAIIGTGKNAGKTSVLNHLVRALAGSRPGRILALTSIGRDGEEEDLVTGGIKPRIYIPAGTLIATARESLPAADAVLEILAMTGIRTALGEVVIARACSRGYVELAGPAAAGDIACCETFFREAAPDCLMLVDGALSRRSPAGGGLTQAAVLASGMAGASTLEDWMARTKTQVRLLSLPPLNPSLQGKIRELFRTDPKARAVYVRGETLRKVLDMPSLAGHGKTVAEAVEKEDTGLFLRGALTGRLLGELLKNPDFSNSWLGTEDGTRFFLDEADLCRLDRARVIPYVLHALDLRMVFVNPVRRDGSLGDSGAMLDLAAKSFKVPARYLGPALA